MAVARLMHGIRFPSLTDQHNPLVSLLGDMQREDGYIPAHGSQRTIELGGSATLETDSDDSMFNESEASFHTMSTIQSDQVADYFISLHGFRYESDESVPRLFPSDYSLDRRDIMLFLIFRLARGGTNVPPIVDEMLRSHGMDGKQGTLRVLEVVTNSGAWVHEMSETYPSATFVSIDTKPLTMHKPHPRITFEVYDFCAGILEPDCSFDLVYTKQAVTVTKDFNRLLQDMHRVLKPNGFLLMDELPMSVYGGEYSGTALPSSSQFTQGIQFLRALWERQGSDVSMWNDLGSRLDPAHPHWENSQSLGSESPGGAIDQIRGFHSINREIANIPVGTWPTDESGKVLGGLMRAFCEVAWRNSVPSMLMSGAEREEVQARTVVFLQDLENVERYKACIKGHLWCAQKL